MDSRVSWADRDYFIYHRDHTDQTLRIAKPRMGRVARQHIVGFSRRYNYPDGRFAGVVSAPITLNHFAQILAQFDLGRYGFISLRDADLGQISPASGMTGETGQSRRAAVNGKNTPDFASLASVHDSTEVGNGGCGRLMT